MFNPMPVEQRPREWMRLIGERRHRNDCNGRELRFITEMLMYRLLAENRLPLVPEDPVT